MEFLPIIFLLVAVMSLMGYTVLGGVIFPRQATSLNWPERMNYAAFVRRVSLHLKHCGWTVQKSSSPEYTMGIRRDNKRFFVICVPNDHAVTPKSLDDCYHVLKKSRWAQALFCVTADRIDEVTATKATINKVFVINYRDMGAIGEMYDKHVGNVPREAEVSITKA